MRFLWAAMIALPSLVAIFAVRLYQVTLSTWLGNACRFQPTCSQYMIESIEKHGFARGVWRGARRIGRCHPWHPGGHDPP